MKRLFILAFLAGGPVFAQTDLLSNLDAEPTTRPVTATFKSTRLLNGHTVETIKAKHLDFRISHRFDRINKGVDEFFGLDYATVRLGLEYGINDNLTFGIGRSTIEKNLDSYLKARLIRQTKGSRSFPVTISALGTLALDPRKPAQGGEFKVYSERLVGSGHLLIARKVSESFSLQLMPTAIFRPSPVKPGQTQVIPSVGIGGRLKFNKRMSINAEYYWVDQNRLKTGQPFATYNPIALGLDIETGGHVFQLIFTNSFGMIEKQFLTQTGGAFGGQFEKGDIHFGFSVSRTFSFDH
ncbi:DUF5777 family beta-barrel protein [Larkinella terrae]|uniref:DUF5777 domain-containing protein n=1 Tax=Larkinella terrae TaxID=2025311 RepID=A0A7K0ET98_9BACT|nr:DUF5777 family beta-barrel protein [Larkinella terrae]MRS64751.1 hypothetical protein [Larkinella terrae]